MFDIQNALYVPGFGISLSKAKDQSLGSPEADFAALMEQAQAAQAKREAEEAAREPFVRAQLSKDDIKALASRYDPVNMTQEEYDSFLDDLIEKGVMETEDLYYIDYRGDLAPYKGLQMIRIGCIDFSQKCASTSLTWTGEQGRATRITHRPTDANALAWAKEQCLWKPCGEHNSMFEANSRRYDIFSLLADTLGAMQRKREGWC